MRIALFSDFPLTLATGIGDALHTLMRSLTERGHAVHLFTPSSGSTPTGKVSVDHTDLPSIGAPGAPAFRFVWPFGVPADLREFRPDLLHTHTFGSVGWQAVRAARALRIPIVGTEHTLPAEYVHYFHFDFPWTRRMIRKFAAGYYQRCDAVLAPSRIVAEELRADGVTREISVIPNPIETALFRPLPEKQQLKEHFGIRKPAVLCFGRLEKEKNLHELWTAFARLLKRGVDAELLVVGDGSERSTLETEARKLGIEAAVRFTGLLRGEELIRAINACEVYAITSRSETQSLTTIQAMACGLPVVAVRSGALPEVVTEAQNGFLVESGDTETFAQRLEELLQDPALRERFGAHGHQSAGAYAPERIAEHMEQMYATILKKASAAEEVSPA